jgi:hypothetical protein
VPRFVLLLIAGLLLISSVAEAQTSNSYVGHKKYVFKPHPADVEEGPLWNIKTQPCPPLAASAAVEAARAELRKLFPDADSWTVDEISMRPHPPGAYWYYAVSFLKATPETMEEGRVIPQIAIPVLMSGTAVEPVVSEWSGDYAEP